MPGRIVVLGAGLIGCYVGGRLASAGADVTLVGRPRVLGPVRERGLRLTDLRGVDLRVPAGKVRTTEEPEALSDAALVILAVKSLATEAAAAEIARYAPRATVLVLQNGVSSADKLRALLPEAAIVSGMVPFNVASPQPGQFHQGTAGEMMAALEPEIEPWARLFADAGLPLELRRDMPAVLWGKLVVNLNNAINALSGVTLAEELGERGYRRAVALCQRETLKVLKKARIKPADALGTPVARLPFVFGLPTFVYKRIMKARGFKVDRHARSSMAEDLEAGRPTEIDFLNGEVVRLADAHGLTAPVNARVVDLVRAAEQGAQPWKPKPLLTALKAAGKRRDRKQPKRRGV